MGSGWSASATSEEERALNPASPSSTSSNDANTIERRDAGTSSSTTTRQKRKRNNNHSHNNIAEDESPSDDDDNNHNHNEEDVPSPQDSRLSFLRRKKRRLAADGSSIWTMSSSPSSLSLSSAWNAFADSLSCGFAKIFLYAAELAAKSAKPRELAGEDDLITGIIQSLDCFQNTDMGILRKGWRVLCVCSNECDPQTVASLFKEESTLASDLAMVLTAMERHPQRIKIQLLGFRALRTILVSESTERWDALFHANAIPVFIQAMRNHSNDVVIQGLGITFLAMIVREISSRPREQIVNLGGIQLIFEAMRNFDDDERLLHTACYALLQIGFTSRIRVIIQELNGADILSEAAKSHMENADLVDLCLSALGKIGNTSISDWSTASSVVLEAMDRWPEKPSIQGHCLVLLIRGSSFMSRRCMQQEAIHQTVQVMKNHPGMPTLQFFSCAVLREFLERSPSQHIRNCILEEGAMECVFQALLHHRDHFGIQPMGLLALMNVLEQRTPAETAAITAFGGNEQTVAAITGVMLELVRDHDDNNN